MTSNFQKAGGISAIISAASYIFAIGLFVTLMAPLADPGISFKDYMGFSLANKSLVFVWIFSMYILHGLSLLVLVPALHERIKDQNPVLALLSSSAGYIWTAFVLLSGFINLWGNEALLSLNASNPSQAESFKQVLTQITLGIDSSDRLLGSLWLGLVSLAAIKTRVLPRILGIFGGAFSLAAVLASLVLPVNDTSASFIFAFGAMIWWVAAGIFMIRR